MCGDSQEELSLTEPCNYTYSCYGACVFDFFIKKSSFQESIFLIINSYLNYHTQQMISIYAFFSFRDLTEGKVDVLNEVNYHSAAEGFVKFVVICFIQCKCFSCLSA